MANPLVSRGRLEIVGGTGPAQVSRARFEVICQLDGPQPEPFTGFWVVGVGV